MAVAQAIGRLGNWFNQELFGRPTTLPWGLEISPAHRPVGYEQFATFHPTFLYEALWNLALAGLLVLIDRRRVLRPGRIFVLYIGGYAVGRFLGRVAAHRTRQQDPRPAGQHLDEPA